MDKGNTHTLIDEFEIVYGSGDTIEVDPFSNVETKSKFRRWI